MWKWLISTFKYAKNLNIKVKKKQMHVWILTIKINNFKDNIPPNSVPFILISTLDIQKIKHS